MEELVQYLGSRFDCLEKKIEGLEAKVNSIEAKVGNVDFRLQKLEGEFTNMKPIFYKAGDTYEVVARREIRDLKGTDFARSFRCTDLHCLARLALPKDIKPTDTNSKSALSFGAISKEHTLRSKALSMDALDHIGKLLLAILYIFAQPNLPYSLHSIYIFTY